MNIDKLLSTLAGLWARHSPTLVMHLAVLLILRVWVLESDLIQGTSMWQTMRGLADAILGELGMDIGRGYVVAGVAYGYLVAVQGLAGLITGLPGLRAWLREPPLEPHVAAQVGQLMQTPPEIWALRDKVRDMVDDYVRGFREEGQSEPFEWLQSRITQWSRFYGLSVLVAFGAGVWLLDGAPGAGAMMVMSPW